MFKPPFRPVLAPINMAVGQQMSYPDEAAEPLRPPTKGVEIFQKGHVRLAHLDAHLYCSLIGTCLSTSELRKLMARFIRVDGLSDLDVHHEAVRLASEGGAVAKALNKALDRRHEAVLRRFSQARDAQALDQLWDDACRRGEIPGAYWAVLSHRELTPELRQRAFGDVHMLSHLVGAANRADVRRLVALERDNEDLRQRLDVQMSHCQELVAQRELTIGRLQQDLGEARWHLQAALMSRSSDAQQEVGANRAAGTALIALHTERRERAEQAAAAAAAEAAGAKESLEQLQQHCAELQRELAAAERQLRQIGGPDAASEQGLEGDLRGRRVLYVGGRPSSTPAIRDLVLRHGGEFRHHDGGLEDRKGLLASAVTWAELVVFPVDCIDHDSAGNLKRLCARNDLPFVALRSASVASFAAAISSRFVDGSGGDLSRPVRCLRNG